MGDRVLIYLATYVWNPEASEWGFGGGGQVTSHLKSSSKGRQRASAGWQHLRESRMHSLPAIAARCPRSAEDSLWNLPIEDQVDLYLTWSVD